MLYAIHRWQHAVFLLWRFHAVHHSDCRIDASTAMRHHPAEFVVVGAGSVAIFAALGLPIWVFPIFNLLSLVEALFRHANMRLAPGFERALELLIISPAMHQMHHSRNQDHYNCNYGNILSLWDRIFGTYGRLDPSERRAIAFGVPGQSEAQATSLLFSWIAPFRPRSAMEMDANANLIASRR